MGGVVSQRFALDFPRPDPRADPDQHVQRGERTGRSRLERPAPTRSSETAWPRHLTPTGPALSYGKEYREGHAEDIAEAARFLASNGMMPASYAAACRAVSNIDYTADLETVSCPTLILQGLEDALTPPGGGVIMSRRIPGSRLRMLENCGHGIPTEQPDEFHAEVETFLTQLP